METVALCKIVTTQRTERRRPPPDIPRSRNYFDRLAWYYTTQADPKPPGRRPIRPPAICWCRPSSIANLDRRARTLDQRIGRCHCGVGGEKFLESGLETPKPPSAGQPPVLTRLGMDSAPGSFDSTAMRTEHDHFTKLAMIHDGTIVRASRPPRTASRSGPAAGCWSPQ
jgi:hypothetical protein